MKQCNKCKQIKDLSDFFKNKSKKDGYQGHCKVCSNNAAKKTYKINSSSRLKTDLRNKNRRKYMQGIINSIKEGTFCSICNESDISCLDFHHLNSNIKEIAPTNLVNYGLESLIKELNKCIVLCSNCHRKLHAGKIKLNMSE